MKIDYQIRIFAGAFILASLLLSHFHNPNWIYFTAFVGVNLIQSAITCFCPLEIVLRKVQPGRE